MAVKEARISLDKFFEPNTFIREPDIKQILLENGFNLAEPITQTEDPINQEMVFKQS